MSLWHRRSDRRSFLKSVGVGLMGATAAGPVKVASADEHGSPPSNLASHVAIVTAVGPGRQLVLRRRDGLVVKVDDPTAVETWRPGDEAVLEEAYENGKWRIKDVQRLYHSIDDETVTGLGKDSITTSAGDLELVSSSEPRGDEQGYVKVPLDKIGRADVVAGLAYLDPQHERRIVAQIGVRRSRR